MPSWFQRVYYSFPIQLLILQLRSNITLLLIWLFLAMLVNGQLGSKYGVKLLFWAPEYFGEVGFGSFFFVGLCFGALVMTWNLTSYLLGAHHFPFLATLARPFTKFSLNNTVLPLSFACYLMFHCITYGYQQSGDWFEVFTNVVGFLFGLASLAILLALYFNFTNKDIKSYVEVRDSAATDLAPGMRHPVDFQGLRTGMDRWRVDTYLTESFRPRLVRSVAHYDPTILLRVFRQNHLNAVVVELVAVVILIALGYLIDYPAFRIPAAASIFLLASVVVAMGGAISYWFHRWRVPVFILLLLLVNYITRFDSFNHRSRGYGLDYSQPTNYSYEDLRSIFQPDTYTRDSLETIRILENWAAKARQSGEEKPKMVMLAVSGGGLKSTLWTMRVLQELDRQHGGNFMDNVCLVAGASGGMIGAGYYRELYWKRAQGEAIDLTDTIYPELVTQDLLNSVAFTIVTNDLFIPWSRFEQGGYTYVKDRGYVFERQLNENVGNIFHRTIADYREAEQNAAIPLMFLTPAIVNDGRRMVISPHGVSYMMGTPASVRRSGYAEIDAVDFGRLFEQNDGYNLSFSSALRMNATFPYILPNVYLPTEPAIEVMDAGFRDDFGVNTTNRFTHVFKDWIQENTSGVVLLQVRAFDRRLEVSPSDNQGILESIFNPLGIAVQVINLQNYEHESGLGMLYDLLGPDMYEVVCFTYVPGAGREEAPISLHLSPAGRQDISDAVDAPENVEAFQRMQELLPAPIVARELAD